jgi:hypothetical protein
MCTDGAGNIISRGGLNTCINNNFLAPTTGTGSGITITGGTGLAVNGADITGTNLIQGGTLTSTGDTNVGGALAVTGATTTNGITNTGNVGTGTLSTTGDATVGGNAIVTGGVTAGGTAQLNGGVTVGGGQTVDMGGNRVQNVATPVAATDAANKGYVDAQLQSSESALNGRINEAFKRIDQNTQGIAIAIAMGGLTIPTNKTFAIGANIGFYDGKQAAAASAAIRLDDTLTLTGGLGLGFDGGPVGGRLGIMAAF